MTTIMLAGGGTGGHLMPALAVADSIHRIHPTWGFVFVGAQRGIEATVLPERGLRHHLLPLQPLYRRQWWKNLRWPLLLPNLLSRIDALLKSERPALVIGTGGYVSGPVLWRAASRGIPTAVLELDVQPGVATRFLASRARAVWLATPEAAERLPAAARAHATVTGAPIVPPDADRRGGALKRFGLDDARPVIVVTGGSQGSLAINRAVAQWIRDGSAERYQVIWATGRGTYAEFKAMHKPPDVQVIPFIDPMADAWAVASLCIARSGMMTLAELCAWGVPSLLIPLPTSAADHQTLNAHAMESAGASRVLPQASLDAAVLRAAIDAVFDDPSQLGAMRSAALARARPDAARDIAERASALVTVT